MITIDYTILFPILFFLIVFFTIIFISASHYKSDKVFFDLRKKLIYENLTFLVKLLLYRVSFHEKKILDITFLELVIQEVASSLYKSLEDSKLKKKLNINILTAFDNVYQISQNLNNIKNHKEYLIDLQANILKEYKLYWPKDNKHMLLYKDFLNKTINQE